MLTSLVFTLIVEQTVTLPSHLGRAAHSAFMRLIATQDPALSDRLHAPDERRPFTCSTLWGGSRRGRSLVLEPNNSFFLRYTGLTPEVSTHLRKWEEEPPAHIELEGVPLAVQHATLDPQAHPWAGQADYEPLAAAYLLPGETHPRQVELEFASPTAFRSGGLTFPVPLPALVYGGLVEKWNAFAPVAVSEEVRRFAEECVAISRYRLSTRAIPAKGGSVQIGFVGRCRYTAVNPDRYWLSLVHLLTEYAFYAGVGYQTTSGMGQTRTTGEKSERGTT
jgi:CRISPR-associated endoribonuclease Cas6